MIAKVFQSGNSQALRLPKEFRLDADEVILERTEEGFLVKCRVPTWEDVFAAIDAMSDAARFDRPEQPPEQERAWD